MAKPFTKLNVIEDTREQRGFGPDLDAELFAVERATLRTGDLTLAGLEDRFVIERKSLGDLVQTVIHDWTRFRKELYRLAAFDFALIVVECNAEDVWGHRYESEAAPASVMGRVHGIFLDHGLTTVFWGPRPVCVVQVERLLVLAHKKLNGGA